MRMRRSSRRDTYLVIVSLLLFLAAWEALARFGSINPKIFAAPSQVLTVLVQDFASGQMLRHLKASAIEFAWGYALAVATGIPFGLLLGANQTLERALSPYLLAMYSTPSQAWWPLIIMSIGLGLHAQVLLIYLFAFFVIVLNVAAGVRSVDPVLLRVGRCFGATRPEIYRKIVVPSTIPYIVTGLRLGVGRAIIGVFLAEFFGASAGLGFYIVRAGSAFQMNRVFAGVLMLVLISVVLTQGIGILQERLTPWRTER